MSYFVYLIPEESGDSYEDEKVDYTVHLAKLQGSILEWFKNLWATDKPGDYIKQTLNHDCPQGLWTIFQDPEDDSGEESPAPQEDLKSQSELFQWLKTNLSVEREIIVNKSSIVIGTTGEFDFEYAFFDAAAVKNGELGTHLQPLVQISPTGEVTKTVDTVRLSAYL